MNITPNYAMAYPNRNFSQNRNNNVYSAQMLSPAKPQVNNQVQFTGLKDVLVKLLGNVMDRPVKLNKENLEFLEFSADVLGVEHDVVINLAKGKKDSQFGFLNSMVERYNGKNFGKPVEEKEDPNIVLELFSRIDNPRDGHFGVIEETNLTMTDIKHCFDKLEDSPSKLNDLVLTYNKLRSFPDQKERLMEILDSPKSDFYLKSVGSYLTDKIMVVG